MYVGDEGVGRARRVPVRSRDGDVVNASEAMKQVKVAARRVVADDIVDRLD